MNYDLVENMDMSNKSAKTDADSFSGWPIYYK